MPQIISNFRQIVRLPEYLSRQPKQNARDYTTSSIGDGSTDARTAILAADSAGPVILPPGTYLIGSSMTLTKPISFAPGAILKPANRGVELTLTRFSAKLDQQVFDITNHGPATFTASGATLSSTAHNLQNGQKVWVSSTGTLPTGLAAATVYFIVNRTTDTFQLSATSGGSAITTTGAGSGTHSVKTYAPVITSNPLLTPENFGVIAGDSSAFVQAAINSVATRGEIVFPGSYSVKDLVIPSDKRIKLNGLGGAFVGLAAGGTFVMQTATNSLRDAPLSIEGFRFASSANTGIGVDLSRRINATITRCAFEQFETGLILHSALSNHVSDCVALTCNVGIKLRASLEASNGNSNLFTNCELYANNVGALVFANGTANPFYGNMFIGCVVQNNNTCGIAAIGTEKLVIVNTHFESNGTGSPTTVDGQDIPTCKMYVKDSSCTIKDSALGSGGVFAKCEDNSTIEFAGCSWATGNLVDDLDGTTSAHLFDTMEIPTGACSALVKSVPKFLRTTKYSHRLPVVMQTDRSLTNLVANQITPTLQNAAGIASQGTEADSVFGTVSYVVFAESLGNVSTHRILISPGLGTLQIGDRFAIAFLCKADQACKVRFDVTSGSFVSHDAIIGTQWQKIVLYAVAATSNTPNLFIYPLDTLGAKVSFSHVMICKTLAAEPENLALRVLENNAVNFSQYSPYLKNTPTLAMPAFSNADEQATSTLIAHSAVTVTGDSNAVWPVMVRGDGSPELQINSQAWATEGTIRVGDTVKLRLTSSGSNSTESIATLYYPEGSRAWSVTTEA